MIDPKKIATMGIGFGSLAICTIGLLSVEAPVQDSEAASARHSNFRRFRLDRSNPKEDLIIPVPELFVIEGEEEEEEQVITLLLVELFGAGNL